MASLKETYLNQMQGRVIVEPNFQTIPQFTPTPTYEVDIPWSHLETTIKDHLRYGLDLDPDFQRGFVWTPEQESAFIEFCLQGGTSARRVLLNCPDWPLTSKGPYVLVDGKQRIHAIRGFLSGRVLAFGYRYDQFSGTLRIHIHRITWCVNNLSTRADVLRWYLEMNSGGTVHTPKELNRVRKLLKAENHGTASDHSQNKRSR